MEIKEIHQKLEEQCPSNYRINEIIPFAYPYRRIVINATVNKSPEVSIQQVYSIFIKAIKSGLNTENQLSHFLGLDKDDFILRELYFLKERGYLDFISGKWLVTESGESFIKDTSILKILSEEEFEFYFDDYTEEIIANNFSFFSHSTTKNRLEPLTTYPIKSADLLKGKSDQLAEVYKKYNSGNAYLVDYDANEIKFDKKEYNDYYLIEYVPTREKENELEPRIEIRNRDKDFTLNKRLTKNLSQQYPNIVYQYSESERSIIAKIEDKDSSPAFERLPLSDGKYQIETLSIWETKAKFMEAIQNSKEKLLIESPWIKKATLNYIQELEAALKRNVTIMVLYGIEGNDEHDFKAIREMERLNENYKNFKLIHLPSHFINTGNNTMVGSHKKLVIKDNEYYLHGSFNFLSFNKNVGQKVANEETLLISIDVKNKWKKVFEDYSIEE